MEYINGYDWHFNGGAQDGRLCSCWLVSRSQTPGKRTRGRGPLGCMQPRPFEPFHLLPLAYWRRFLLTGGGE